MKRILHTLESAYTYPVDIEFTVNLTGGSEYRVNIVQCRPFEARKNAYFRLDAAGPVSVRGDGVVASGGSSAGISLRVFPESSRVLMASTGGTVIGRSREIQIDRIIFVPPQAYAELPVNLKYQTARTIGLLMKQTVKDRKSFCRPAAGDDHRILGIPVTFSEICGAACVCEIVQMSENSYPTYRSAHTSSTTVEFDILYLAYPAPGALNTDTHVIAEPFFRNAGCRIAQT